MRHSRLPSLGLLVGACLVTAIAAAATYVQSEDPMMTPENGWSAEAAFTVGETVDGYTPPGILDGTGAIRMSHNTVRVFINHEFGANVGTTYELANGTQLTGARVSYFDFERKTRKLCGAGPAYDTIHDREGNVVTHPAQINKSGNATDGLGRLCSAQLVEKGDYGFRDDIFFTGEEDGTGSGGSEWALDIATGELWACPDLGRGAWENVTAVDTGSQDTIGLLLGDDTAGAPLYLYVGTKGPAYASFLVRNGLVGGTLYAWAADNGDLTPAEFNGEGSVRTGTWVEVAQRDAAKAGMPGYDDQGYLDDSTLRAAAFAKGAFSFSRPEDLGTNPDDGRSVVFASTGRSALFSGADSWGTVYVIDLDFGGDGASAELRIVHDADDLATPDAGIRSPDNLTWALNGYVYVQEDRSVSGFGAVTGREASIWQLDPWTGDYEGVTEMDRWAVPAGQVDTDPLDLGDWESSGVIDVTKLFKTTKGETLLLAVVQAHSVRGGAIDSAGLVQGGQILFLSKDFEPQKGKK